MTHYHESKLVKMIGSTDGHNKLFETPTRYVAGTIRVFINGNACESPDDRWGWAEESDVTIRFKVAPKVGDQVQAFYQDKDIAGQLTIDDVVGSPFDPNGVYP